MSLDKFFDGLPTASHAEFFDNEHSFGVMVHFTEKGHGFGALMFSVDKATGEVFWDDEDEGVAHSIEIIKRLHNTTVTVDSDYSMTEESA